MTQSSTASIGHTAGPWTRTPDQQFRHDYSRGVRGPDGMYVAAALDFNRTDRDAEVEANARLIAASPDLLAACQALTHRLQSLVESGDCGSWSMDIEESYVSGCAAIAKATGTDS